MPTYNKRFNGEGEYEEDESADIWPGTTAEGYIPPPIADPQEFSSFVESPWDQSLSIRRPQEEGEETGEAGQYYSYPEVPETSLVDEVPLSDQTEGYNLTPEDIEYLQGYEDFGSEWGGGFRDIAEKYPATTAGFSDFLRQMQAAELPFSEVGGGGRIQFGTDSANIADVMRNYSGGGEAWQFYPDQQEQQQQQTQEQQQQQQQQTQDQQQQQEEDPSIFSMYPQQYQDYITQGGLRVGDDPLSQMQDLAAEGLLQGGGQIRTPLTAQTNQAISDLIASGGDLGLTPDEQKQRSILDKILEEGGGSAATPLEQETQDILRGLIERGGRLPPDDQRRAMEIEAARSPLDILRQSQLAEGRAEMAGRGLLGQGPEIEYGQRLEERLAPMYTQAAQEIQLDEADRADKRYNTALEALSSQAEFQRLSADDRYTKANALRTELTLDMAQRQDDRLTNAINQSANLTIAQSQNLVSFINATTGVQKMRVTAALDLLRENADWNQFLAEYDLDRTKFLELMDTGRFAEIAPLLMMMLQGIQVGGTGFREGRTVQ